MITNFKGKTAVLTGAGSGFGLECARIGAALGMNLVLADVQQDALDAATAEMRALGAPVLAVKLDVAKAADVEALGAAVPAILRQCEALNITDPNQIAYILATAQHESRFGTPMYERSQSLVEDRNPFSQNPDGSWTGRNHLTGQQMTAATFEQLETEYWDACYGGMLGNEPGTTDAARYRGRGYVQLTGRNNYERMTNSLNEAGFSYAIDGVTYGGQGNPPIDLLANPEHINQVPDLAARVLVSGMSAGSFTGRKLADSINQNGVDFTDARRIVNGDVAQNGALVGGYAQSYADGLRAGGNS